MKRKLLSLLLALAMLLTLLPQAATTTRAAGTSGTCGDDLRWSYNPATGRLSIIGQGDMWYYDDPEWGDPAPWYEYCEDITEVSLPSGLTSIGSCAFLNCTGLRSVSIPTSVTQINWSAFQNCTGLTSVSIPANMGFIGSGAFSHCSALTELSLPENVYIDSWAFEYCSSLSSMTIPEGIEYLSSGMFYNCENLSSVSLPQSLTAIGWEVFENCVSLSSITIPENVESIDEDAFYNCESLSSVSLPDGLLSLGYCVFSNCYDLAEIDLPDSLESIGWEAFCGCSSLRSVVLPENLQSLGGYAFEDCDSLSSVTFPDSLTDIGWGVFESCYNLSSVTLPSALKELPAYTFWGCANLSSVDLPAGLESIGEGAFEYCESLSSISFPTTLKSIGASAFYDCISLRTVVLPKSVEKLDRYVFAYCPNLKALVVRNPACKVCCYEKNEYIYSGDDSWENLEQVRGDGQASDVYESWYDDTLGIKGRLIVYGPHDAEKENAPMMTEIEEGIEYRNTYGYRYIENCAKTLGYTFYATNVFSDVKEGKYYEIPVAWAYGKGVTNGKDATHFAPNDTCTRGQVVRFLWNAMGQPEPTITDCPFVDVTPGKYYYDAMLWALENGITNGKDATHFAPNDTCTRGQVVRFLWNALGQPEPTMTENPFEDAVPGKYYYDAMLWALENGVTNGKDATHFAPNDTCTRGQVVTFLFNTPSTQPSVPRADDEEVYEANFSDFTQRMAQAREAENNGQRYQLLAMAEAELLDTAALIPTCTQGGNYAISRVAPHTTAHVDWGNDGDRLHGLVVSEDLLTRAEREELEALWAQAVKGNGSYDPAAYLTGKGHSLRTTHRATFSELSTLDWLDTCRSADSAILANLVEGLVEYDNLGNLRPALAESWEISDDGMTYTFHLRHGVKWYDSYLNEHGEVTAHDFVAGFHHMMDCRAGIETLVASGYGEIVGTDAYLWSDGEFENVGYKALDDYTLQITLNKPVPFFLTLLNYNIFLPMCESFFLEHGGVYGKSEMDNARDEESYTYGSNTDLLSQVYCGPFVLQQLQEDMMITCVKNPNYYNAAAVSLEYIEWIKDWGEDPLGLYYQTVNGYLDGVTLTEWSGTLYQAKEDGCFDQYAYNLDTTATTYYGALNLNRGVLALENGACASPKSRAQQQDTTAALNNKNFRKAVMHAFDKLSFNTIRYGEVLGEVTLRNMITKPDFVKLDQAVTDENGHTFPAGTFYGEMVQYYCDQLGCQVDCQDGVDGWYKPEAAQAYLAAARQELGDQVSWPIQLDLVYYAGAEDESAQAYKDSIESTLGAENVVVNLVPAYNGEDYYGSTYSAGGAGLNCDVFNGSGWGPDYGDPSTYLDPFDPAVNGYMLYIMGLVL